MIVKTRGKFILYDAGKPIAEYRTLKEAQEAHSYAEAAYAKATSMRKGSKKHKSEPAQGTFGTLRETPPARREGPPLRRAGPVRKTIPHTGTRLHSAQIFRDREDPDKIYVFTEHDEMFHSCEKTTYHSPAEIREIKRML